MSLRCSVYVTPSLPFQRPDGKRAIWSPISSTLIIGEKEAVLVDTPFTIDQTNDLADWIESQIPSKTLTAVYITHGHGDHWFGLPVLLRRFPSIMNTYATKGTIEHMKEDSHSRNFTRVWKRLFPGLIDENFQLASPLHDGQFVVEGHVFQAIEVGHTDTHDSTVLWVPDIKLAVCGDVVYGDVHQMLAAANTSALQEEWIAAIETVEALGPRLVVAGHKKPGEMDGVWHLANSKKYIRDFMRLQDDAVDAEDLKRKMVGLYPTRMNPLALEWSATVNMKMKMKL
ncbi:hypothetical protein ASPWEDRAFT_155989 [Aspergillus wentii DTO 134E9]|uniref:Metallo-beta-lactamase domain-containing protein n=1 Tax=Aspergillus wentii DTO 134E9 TaxID=1073089 RepID=A0A1L9RLI8_ASPWE|nr:uncharacterized protein ASPWEDRAFT_155989 [Aspergillus wentii DTO 134E9]KAI9929761.1 hypothetical protein MW887_001237 [Aspergillus wentii]OJJ35781.1 hypothetical protein ASPWEDRAFT_155989 [Aspergillus wentii DTO 134E9]